MDTPHVHQAQLRGSSATAQGRRRLNEDSCELAEQHGGWYAVVADGMGGGIDGSRFSLLAVKSFSLTLTSRPTLDRSALETAVRETIAAVYQLRLSNPAYHSSGTTLVAATIVPHPGGAAVTLANIGDSPAYLVTVNGPAQQLTYDHTYGEQLVASGVPRQDAEQHPQAAHLTHVLGDGVPIAQIPFCFSEHHLMANEQLVLCSDGVAKILSTALIADLVRHNPPEQAAEVLVQTALAHGSQDNATAIVISVGVAGQAADPVPAAAEVTTVTQPLPQVAYHADQPPAAPAKLPAHSRTRTIAILVVAVCAGLAGMFLLWYAFRVATAAPAGALPLDLLAGMALIRPGS